MNDETIHVLMTGGTIDSEYNGDLDTVEPRLQSVIPQYFSRTKSLRSFEFTQVCMKDSRRLSDVDRRSIAEAVNTSPATKFIVTHGTYTMPESAVYLSSASLHANKTVILTSATIPLEGVTMSDGGFNLGFAVAQCDILEPGVYVCIAGQVHTPAQLKRLIDEERFVTIYSKLPDA